MRLTKSDRENLDQFGCTFNRKQRIFYVRWPIRQFEQAKTATILARVGYFTCEAGPVLCLALEISPVRPLPHYCYFPFDLKNQAHRKYISQLTQSGEIKLRFLSGNRLVERTYELLPYPRSRSAESYMEALEALKEFKGRQYNFKRAVNEIEQKARIPELFERVVSEAELPKLLEIAKEAARRAPAENRESARATVQEFVRVLRPYYGRIKKFLVEDAAGGRRTLLVSSDLHRLFFDDPERFIEFFSDAVAARLSVEELQELSTWPKSLESLCQFLSRYQSADNPERDAILPQLPKEIVGILQRLAAGRGLSLTLLKSLIATTGLDIRGKPGRIRKDYSAEYGLKASGLSWRDVARTSLKNRPELQQEFGTDDYDSLPLEKRVTLQSRIRQGVRQHARRLRVSPSPGPEAGKPRPTEGEQKNPTNSAMHKIPAKKLPS